MPSTGQLSPTDAATNSNGDVAWGSVENIFASDNSRATADLGSGASITDSIESRGYDFSSVPANAVITGFTVRVERRINTLVGDVPTQDFSVFLGKNATNDEGDNKAQIGDWPGTEAVATYGGSSDLWGQTWDVSDLDALTTVFLACTAGGETTRAEIDHITIEVHYDVPVSELGGVQDSQVRPFDSPDWPRRDATPRL